MVKSQIKSLPDFLEKTWQFALMIYPPKHTMPIEKMRFHIETSSSPTRLGLPISGRESQVWGISMYFLWF